MTMREKIARAISARLALAVASRKGARVTNTGGTVSYGLEVDGFISSNDFDAIAEVALDALMEPSEGDYALNKA
jgi:hypothetical protein